MKSEYDFSKMERTPRSIKICFVIPFHYNWGCFSNIKSHYEYLQILGYNVDLFSRTENKIIDYNSYDQIWLMGAGAKIDKETFDSINIPVLAFGWSDPNLFNEDHYENCTIYFTNDLKTYNKLQYHSDKISYYYQTTCDKRYHKNLNLEKTTDILVYGVGDHKFISNRNEVVNKLREKGFNIKVFGRGWDEHEHTYDFIKGQQFIEEINRAKIVLDITNKDSAWGHRIFEASACGTPVLTYNREDTKQLLQIGTEIILYKDFADLLGALEVWLDYPDHLEEFGLNAQRRCYRDHDISVRIKALLNKIKECNL